MRLGITSKLFLGLLATSIVVAVAMSLAMQVSFQRGFLGYLNQQEVQRVDSLIPALAQSYREHGNWRAFDRHPGVWYNLLRSISPDEASGPSQEALTGLNYRLALLDSARERVAGAPAALGPDAILRTVEVQGQVVGYVALLPFQKASTSAAVEFEQQQLKSIWLIGGLSVLLAAAVAVMLARLLLAPVRRIAQATRQMAAGDYSCRMEAHTRDELGRLAHDFNQLALSLQRNEQLRREFTADVSHELRTPLAVLQGELEAIQDGVRPFTEASLRSLQAEVAALGKLINDLYDLSLSDAGALTYRKQAFDLRSLIEELLESYGERLASRKISTELELGVIPLPVLADPDRLRQLFANLLENTLRYTDAGGRLRIAASTQADRIHVDLQDSAPGLPAEVIPRLFERFYRAEVSRNRAGGGAGLGLAICRNIVEAHGGEISARPSPLGGLWMHLSFPQEHS